MGVVYHAQQLGRSAATWRSKSSPGMDSKQVTRVLKPSARHWP
jgi:hypothetical protein